MKEVITLHVGQAGLQIGNAISELYCAEHFIDCSGHRYGGSEDNTFQSFFIESKAGLFVPRSIFVDLEPTVLDEIRTGSYKNLYHPNFLLSGKEDAANCFARGFYMLGAPMAKKVSEEVRHLMEICDSVTAMMFIRSMAGGTGSGLTAAIVEMLSEYSKITHIEVPIFPSTRFSTSTVEPYNAILAEHFIMDDMDLSLALENEALYYLFYFATSGCTRPNFTDINRIIAQVCSSYTAGTRFDSFVNNNLVCMQTNLVPYPRLHFPMTNFGPVLDCKQEHHQSGQLKEIMKSTFNPTNQLVLCDVKNSKYMSCSLLFRGHVRINEVYKWLTYLKTLHKISFVDYVPTGFKVGIVDEPIAHIPGQPLARVDTNLSMVANNSAIGAVITRINQKYKHLAAKRAFIHWYVGDGLEECEFLEAIMNLHSIAEDYEESCKSTQSLKPEAEDTLENIEEV